MHWGASWCGHDLWAHFDGYEVGAKGYAIFVDEIHCHHEEPPMNFNSLSTVDGGNENAPS